MSIFQKISQEHNNIKIVIAEHPRCQYDKKFWIGYERFSGKTAQLIKYSSGVIGHFSTALALAQIYQKEIILLTSTSSYFPFQQRVDNAEKILDCTKMNMNKLITLKSEKRNKKEFSLYEYFSLIPESKKLNDELFMNFFKKFI